ncbi:YitT family protein [Pueribacillus sp. YX66]|uniref:YczE/YyaS/YitT family protein n=1 Tax=Pueribacillus sp. YX66 TaxID=3229242 RepID=UPI00358CFD29
MNHKKVTTKRLVLYVFGLFFLSLGVSFSIEADLGVSPVSSLAYALTLSAGLSIGITTVLSNVLYVIVQIILNKRIDMREFAVQFIILFLFGFFMDSTLFIVQLFPTPENIIIRLFYLIISLFIIAAGLLCYSTAKLPLMPYDALTFVIRDRFKLEFSKAKMASDGINVFVSATICLTFVQSLGSVGIGTIIAAYCIGKIIGLMKVYFYKPLYQWVYEQKSSDEKTNVV